MMSVNVSSDDGNVKPDDDGRILPPPVPGAEKSDEIPPIPLFGDPYIKPVPTPGIPWDKSGGDEPPEPEQYLVTFGEVYGGIKIVRDERSSVVNFGEIRGGMTIIEDDSRSVSVTFGEIRGGATVICEDHRNVDVSFGEIRGGKTMIHEDSRSVDVTFGEIRGRTAIIHDNRRAASTTFGEIRGVTNTVGNCESSLNLGCVEIGQPQVTCERPVVREHVRTQPIYRAEVIPTRTSYRELPRDDCFTTTHPRTSYREQPRNNFFMANHMAPRNNFFTTNNRSPVRSPMYRTGPYRPDYRERCLQDFQRERGGRDSHQNHPSLGQMIHGMMSGIRR